MNEKIHNYIKALTDMTNKHQSEIKTTKDNISDILQNLTATNSKTDNHEEKFIDISSKLSKYEDRLKKLSIKDTHIQTLYLQITKLIDTSPKTDKNE